MESRVSSVGGSRAHRVAGFRDPSREQGQSETSLMGEAESLAADVVAALDRLGTPFMLVGAAALAVRGVTRGSHDIDFMTTESIALTQEWGREIPAPMSFELFCDDPLQGTIRFSRKGASPVDLVVAKARVRGHHSS